MEDINQFFLNIRRKRLKKFSRNRYCTITIIHRSFKNKIHLQEQIHYISCSFCLLLADCAVRLLLSKVCVHQNGILIGQKQKSGKSDSVFFLSFYCYYRRPREYTCAHTYTGNVVSTYLSETFIIVWIIVLRTPVQSQRQNRTCKNCYLPNLLEIAPKNMRSSGS